MSSSRKLDALAIAEGVHASFSLYLFSSSAPQPSSRDPLEG